MGPLRAGRFHRPPQSADAGAGGRRRPPGTHGRGLLSQRPAGRPRPASVPTGGAGAHRHGHGRVCLRRQARQLSRRPRASGTRWPMWATTPISSTTAPRRARSTRRSATPSITGPDGGMPGGPCSSTSRPCSAEPVSVSTPPAPGPSPPMSSKRPAATPASSGRTATSCWSTPGSWPGTDDRTRACGGATGGAAGARRHRSRVE